MTLADIPAVPPLVGVLAGAWLGWKFHAAYDRLAMRIALKVLGATASRDKISAALQAFVAKGKAE